MEIMWNESFNDVITDKVMSKDVSEYDERFNDVWQKLSEDIKKK